MRARHAWVAALPVVAAAVVFVSVRTHRSIREVHDGGSPRFASSDVIALSNVARISKFRSGVGHDFSSGPESCRSMKHYVMPIAGGTTIEVRAPFPGEVSELREEGPPGGRQLYLRSREHPAYTVRLFHVDPAPGVQVHTVVEAGQVVGTFPPSRGIDVAVAVRTWGGERFVSIYDLLSEEALTPYGARGLQRSDFILTRAYRDAHPFRCDPDDPNQSFADHAEDTRDDWVDLTAGAARR